jgi:microcystin-dependent protein
MADPFVAEIRIFPFNFAPKGWAWCDGQLLPLSQNTALFSLLGTTYGGDGKSTFALPDLQGRAPMHPGQGPGLSLHDLGETGGSETVTLLESEIPAHSHGMRAYTQDPADLFGPGGAALALEQRQCLGYRRESRVLRSGSVGARWRRPAAQQPAAVPDVLLLHRPPGCFPAAHLTGGNGVRSKRSREKETRRTPCPTAISSAGASS